MGNPRKQGIGTTSRRTVDVQRVAEAIKMAGIDPRHWVSYGTVAVVNDAGEPDFTDPHAIWIGPEGVEVDVVLEPISLPITAHYAGVMGGDRATIMSPIRPGDRVLVVLPDGDLTGPPVIVSILHSAAVPVPIDQADKKPVFRNDRVLVYAKLDPIEIRTAGGAKMQVNQDGTVVLNEGTLGVARKTDPVEVTFAQTSPTSSIAALAVALLATGVFMPSSVPPPPPAPQPDFTVPGTVTKASDTVRAGGDAS